MMRINSNAFLDTTMLRLRFKSKQFSPTIAESLLQNRFKIRAKKLTHPNEYRPDFVYDPTWHHEIDQFKTRRYSARGNFRRSTLIKYDQDKDERDSGSKSSYRPTTPVLESRPRLLFTYPSNGQDTVTITSNDVLRLPEGYYLNDSIIDFDLRRLYIESPASVQAQVHIFSSFFYRKLSNEGTLVNARINIFEKRFSFVPINEQYV